MPMVEYFDEGTQSRKKKDFGYGAMGKELARKFMDKQKASALLSGGAPPKMTSNKMEGEGSISAKKTNMVMGTPETKKQREKRHQDYDQKELDKNKPSEAKTKKKKVQYVKLDEDDDRYHKRLGATSGSDYGYIPGS